MTLIYYCIHLFIHNRKEFLSKYDIISLMDLFAKQDKIKEQWQLKIIILNYQRVIPPFILSIAKTAKNKGYKIIYITSELRESEKNTDTMRKYAEMHEISKLSVYLHFPLALTIPFRRDVRNDLHHTRENRLSGIHFFMQYYYRAYASYLMKTYAEKYIENDGEDCCVLSTWFHIEAYTVALLKQKYPALTTASLAHSFEVDPTRNQYIKLMQNKIRHQYIDNINFISKTIFSRYKKDVMQPLSINDQNISLLHLGSFNDEKQKNPDSKDPNTFTFVTCSACISLKRLDYILNCLENRDFKRKIKWIHMGSGNQLQALSERADLICKRKRNLAISFAGAVANADVTKLYRTEHVDLFINVSSVEGIPVSIMEALSYGIPVIATDVGGNHEIVDHKCGKLIPLTEDCSALYDAIEYFINLDKVQMEEYRLSAIHKWQSEYNATDNYNKYIDLLYDIMKRTKK